MGHLCFYPGRPSVTRELVGLGYFRGMSASKSHGQAPEYRLHGAMDTHHTHTIHTPHTR